MHRLVCWLLFGLTACGDETISPSGPISTSPDALELATSHYPDGSIQEEFQFYLNQGQTIKHGAYSAYYASGPLQMQGFYKEGLKDSIWSHFDENGRTTLKHTWRGGLKWEGAFRLYWPNGNPSEYGTYHQGLWHGTYASYYPSGKTEVSAQYVNHKLHGTYLELYESGKRKVLGAYWQNLKDGTWIHYAESGIELQREQYERGALETSGRVELETFDDGSTKSVTPYLGDEIHGTYVEYWPNGAKRVEVNYYDGLKDGPTSLYWDNGRVREQGRYLRGRKHGLWQNHHSSGILVAVLPYERGRLSGPYVAYHTNGNIQWEGTYDRGLKIGVWTNYARDGKKRLQQIWEDHELSRVIDCTAEECQ